MNLPRLPRDWYITGLSLELGNARDDNCPLIRLRTDDEGAGAYLRVEVEGEIVLEPGDLTQLAAVGESLIGLHDASRARAFDHESEAPNDSMGNKQ